MLYDQKISAIITRDRIFHLRDSIRVFIQDFSYGVCLICEELYICSYGKSFEDAQREFCEDFLCQWEELVEEDDELDTTAKRVRRDLKNLVDFIEKTY